MRLYARTDPVLLSHSNDDKDEDAVQHPRLNGSEGIQDWSKFNVLYRRLQHLRKHAETLLRDLSCAHTLDTGMCCASKSQMWDKWG